MTQNEIQPLARTFDELLQTINLCLIKMHESGYIVHVRTNKEDIMETLEDHESVPTVLKAQVFKRIEENTFKRLVPPPPERKRNDKRRIQRATEKKTQG